jgi:hypothetical protein
VLKPGRHSTLSDRQVQGRRVASKRVPCVWSQVRILPGAPAISVSTFLVARGNEHATGAHGIPEPAGEADVAAFGLAGTDAGSHGAVSGRADAPTAHSATQRRRATVARAARDDDRGGHADQEKRAAKRDQEGDPEKSAAAHRISSYDPTLL